MKFRIVLVVVLLACVACAADKPRVFITDSDSWQVSGGAAASEGAFGASVKGGARPQTAEIIKTFSQRCPAVTITLNREKADYIVLLQHEGGKELFLRDNKIAVFNKDEDMIHSGSTRSLGNAVKDACAVITGRPIK